MVPRTSGPSWSSKHLGFYDENLAHALTKRVAGLDTIAVAEVLAKADRRLAAIPAECFDFDWAKSWFQNPVESP